MTTTASPGSPSNPDDGVTTGPPITFDLKAGHVTITPMSVDGQPRYALSELPSEPLTDDDVEELTVALHVARSGHAVLIDVEEYADTD